MHLTAVWPHTFSFVNARVVTDEGVADSLRFRSNIVAVGERPQRRDTVVDLDGAFVLPGLVNAHDHLELNHYGRLKFQDRYANASEWIDDMRPRLTGDAAIRAAQAHPLAARLFAGALKNLLSGVTTVAHHNPFYKELRRGFPIRVVRRYGWAHSFGLEHEPAGARGEPGGDVAERFRSTPADAPFMVHLGEGVDDAARAELPRLEALGCVAPNTVLVHGVAIDIGGWWRVSKLCASLVWCPASNAFLFRRTAEVRQCLDAGVRVALATDSRLSGARDLLDELRAAASLARVSASELLRMVTSTPADMLKLPRAGRLAPGKYADLVVVPARKETAGDSLLVTPRRDVALVMLGGRPLVAGTAFRQLFRDAARPIRIDEVERLADARLARAIARCPIPEPGVTCV
jgi:cytosine/adenosine deaminase-related metal-dependent hydrolase